MLRDEVERAIGQLAAEPAPSVNARPSIADNALDVTVSYYVASPGDQYRVQHELRGRSLERLHREGLGVPAGDRAA
jgi:hypothetical protein